MRVIGLTGGIACGKTTVSNWLRNQPDCHVIDGDLLSRELCAPGGAALPLIRRRFGNQVFFTDGTLNRQALGKIVFESAAERDALDRLMAPLLHELTLKKLDEARSMGFALCFLDYPLLFEKGYDSLCDSVWCVYLPRDIQLERLMSRDGLSREEALQRMDAVLSSREKASRSNTVIDNSGEIAFTLSLLPPLLEAERMQIPPAGRRRRSERYAVPEASREGAGRSAPDTGSSPVPAVSPPAGFERPDSARRKKRPRKSSWKLPAWLMILLICFSFILACCLTAHLMMQAYLARQSEAHLAEQQAILANYPHPGEFLDIIEAEAKSHNLNPAFVSAIIRNESSFQPQAESSVGARGLMQLMPETAEWIAHKTKTQGYAFERMYDPESNIRFGCWYIQYLAGLFHGDPVCVACAYHAGQGQVTAWLSDSRYSDDGVTLSLNRLVDGPTKIYAGRVIRSYGIYQALYFESGLRDDGNLSDPMDSGVRE